MRPAALEEGLVKVLRHSPAQQDRRIHIVVCRHNSLSDEAVAAYNASGYASGSERWDCYEDWPGLPRNAYLIHFYLGPKYGVIYGHAWRTPEEHIEFGFTNSEGRAAKITMCFRTRDLAGVRITEDDKRALGARIRALWESDLGVREPYGKVVEILTAREVLLA